MKALNSRAGVIPVFGCFLPMAITFAALYFWMLLFLSLNVEQAFAALQSDYSGEGDALVAGALRPQSSSNNGALKVVKYALNAELDPSTNQVSASITITIKNTTDKSFASLYFRNTAETMISRAARNSGGYIGGIADIQLVRTMTNKAKLKFASSKTDPSIVQVKLGKRKLGPKKSTTIRLDYFIEVPECSGRFGYTETTKGKLYALGWCWPYLADYRNGHWSLSALPETGENRFSRATTYDCKIKAPKAYKVASSGVDRTIKGAKYNITVCKTKGLRDFAVVACNFMKKDSAIVRGVRLNCWYLPGAYEKQYRSDVWPAMKDAASYLSRVVGMLPFREVDLVQAFSDEGDGTVGVENSGLIIFGTDRYYYSRESPPKPGYLTRTAYHEMCHQWFFAAVGNDEYNEPWLDEGIASYYDKWAMWTQSSNTTRYLAQIAGKPVAQYLADQRNAFRKSVSSVEKTSGETKLNQSVVGFKSYFGTAYSTSVWFLLQLEDSVGHQNFRAIMKDYYATYRLKEATTSGFLRIVRAHCPVSAKNEVNALIKKYF